jgi:hypothetical protein
MIDTYGTYATGHVWLGIDPGVTTGVALLDEKGVVLNTFNLHSATVKDDLDEMIRRIHRSGMVINVVKEKIARVGGGELARTLEGVVHDVQEVVVDVYDLPMHEVTPGEWKSSRVAKTLRPTLDKKLSAHEKDAICMAAYVLDKGVKPQRALKVGHWGRKRLEDTPDRVRHRIYDAKRRAKRKAARDAQRSNG